MDCTHIKWTLCPKDKKHHASGKEGFPTLVFQVCVDQNKRVINVSQQFLGSINDKTICENDLFSLGVKHGTLSNIEYELYDKFGVKYKCKGGYLIVDGGYIDHICFIDPDKNRLHHDSVIWSEWLESVRKDVECFFGILKQRWRFLRNGVVYHSANTMEDAFETACLLNNMILMFDENAGLFDYSWETVEWETLDPNGKECEDADFREPTALNEHARMQNEGDIMFQERYRGNNNTVNGEVTVFYIHDPKSSLKEALQQSFVVQWIKQQLKWPKRFD